MAPRGLVGAALLLWGASVGFLPVAVVLASPTKARDSRRLAAAARRVTLVGRVVLFAVIAKLGYAAVTTAFPGSALHLAAMASDPARAVAARAGARGRQISERRLPIRFARARRDARGRHDLHLRGDRAGRRGHRGEVERWYFVAAAAIVAWALVRACRRARARRRA
jgi:hypothetical protein